ncbi:MAG: SUMF1/EgtB/PvdO family nonheme iron enzyme [Candidatus Omnitrophota bacterium]
MRRRRFWLFSTILLAFVWEALAPAFSANENAKPSFQAKELFLFSLHWMQATAPGENGDFNHDGVVDVGDLLLFIDQFELMAELVYTPTPEKTNFPAPTPVPFATPTAIGGAPTPEESTPSPTSTPTPTGTFFPPSSPTMVDSTPGLSTATAAPGDATPTPTATLYPAITPDAEWTFTPTLLPDSTPSPSYTPDAETTIAPTPKPSPTILSDITPDAGWTVTPTPTWNPAPSPTFTPPSEMTAVPTPAASLTPLPSITPDSVLTLTPTPSPNTTYPPDFTPETEWTAAPTPTISTLPTLTPISTYPPDVTPEAEGTDTPTPNPAQSPTLALEGETTFTPTPTLNPTQLPSLSPTAALTTSTSTPTRTSTPTMPPDILHTPEPLPTSGVFTPTPKDNPESTPGSGGTTPGNSDSTPVYFTPTPIPPTPMPADPVRQWNLHRALSLFSEPVVPPGVGGIASSEEGYAVYVQTQTQEPRFIAIDRFGRIFSRDIPISLSKFSGLSMVDGGTHFGEFFENPADTRRFLFERFTLWQTMGNPIVIDHLGADAIRWSFGGAESGYAMTVLRHPDIVAAHRLNSEGEYLGVTEIQSPIPLPLEPYLMSTAVSGGVIGVLYSSNYNQTSYSSAPLFLRLIGLDGELLTTEAISITADLAGESFTGDGEGNFYLGTTSRYGPRLLRITDGAVALERILPVKQLIDIAWQDNLLWALDGSNHTMQGFNEDGELKAGPVSIYPPSWDTTLQWLRLKKSGPDLGAFFTDYTTRSSVYYMQVESGPMVTPTPTPASGVPTGATIAVELAEGIALDMVQVSAGTFTMGSPETEEGRQKNEGPQHLVTITKKFYISRYEITNAQYQLFDSKHSSSSSGAMGQEEERLPVVSLSWNKAVEFCDWLSAETDYTFSLPTEAEWEYVCRGGTQTRRPWGDDPNDDMACAWANTADVSSATNFAFKSLFPCDDGYPGLALIGSFPTNPFGVNDMMGNVWEWCQDWFGMYTSDPAADPSGPPTGQSRVFRGGSYQDGPSKIRSAYRSGLPPGESHPAIGFRVVIRD